VPFIVEMGVFLDVLVAVLIMEVFVYRIKENFDSIDVGTLGELKE
jgi:hydrogenase-4 component E